MRSAGAAVPLFLLLAPSAYSQCGPEGKCPYPPGRNECPTGPPPPGAQPPPGGWPEGCEPPGAGDGPPGGGPPGGGPGGGGGPPGGGASVSRITCPTDSDYVGNTSLTRSPAGLLGAVACIDTKAIAYRETLPARIAGTDTNTVGIFGPFEAGFASFVPGLSCLGDNTIDGGIDTYTAELLAQHLCDDDSLAILDTCGDHARPRHFHELLTNCLSSQDAASGHSSRIGTAGDDRGVYGFFEDAQDTRPILDACGAHVGVTPDSAGVAVVHYHAQVYPPYFIGCYANSDATTTVEECRDMYPGCTDADMRMSLTTAHGSDEYQQWCPCWDRSTHSNVPGATAKPKLWPEEFGREVPERTGVVPGGGYGQPDHTAGGEKKPAASGDSTSTNDRSPLIIGCVIGGVAALVLIVGLVWWRARATGVSVNSQAGKTNHCKTQSQTKGEPEV